MFACDLFLSYVNVEARLDFLFGLMLCEGRG